MGFLVFSNIGAKDSIDLVVAVPKLNELRIAGIRIRTSSYHEKKKAWAFGDDTAEYLIEKPHFFYIFCLKRKKQFKPTFIVISSGDLRKLTRSLKENGNFGIEISKRQIEEPKKWSEYIENFEQIRRALEK